MKIAVILISSIIFSASCYASIFQCNNGEFRDTPCPNGKGRNISSAMTETLSPQQQKLCKSVGKYADSVVDLYISGTSRTEAIQQIDTNMVTGKTSELLKKITNSIYDDLLGVGAIRSQDARTALKSTMNIKGETICLESISNK